VPHSSAGQCLVAIPPLEHRNDFALCVLVREINNILRVSREKGSWDSSIVPLHRLVFVLARVEPGAKRCQRYLHRISQTVEHPQPRRTHLISTMVRSGSACVSSMNNRALESNALYFGYILS
jgi:hypothetical protein